MEAFLVTGRPAPSIYLAPFRQATFLTVFDSGGNGNNGFVVAGQNVNFFVADGNFGPFEELEIEFTLDANGGVLTSGPTTVPANVEPLPPPAPPLASEFEITLVPVAGFDPNTRPSEVSALEAAAARWSEIIVGDLPATNGVDDLEIQYDFNTIDGPGGTIGSAGPQQVRQGSLIPFFGVMTFDSADTGNLDAGQLEALFLHEMGHVLGLGTLWDFLGCSTCRDTGDPRYNNGQGITGACPNAVQAFRDLGGVGEPQIELDGGGGTRCGHFDELLYRSEVMTGFLTTNPQTGISEISTMTVGSLQDLGYMVNFDAADDFVLPTPLASLAGLMQLNETEWTGEDMTMEMTEEDAARPWEDISGMMLASAGISTPSMISLFVGMFIAMQMRL